MAIISEELKREHDQLLNEGAQLAKNKDFVLLTESKNGGKKLVMGDLLEGLDHDPFKMGQTALMLSNMRRFIDHLDETTRALQIGDFERFAFRIVRAVFPNLILHDIASVQAMTQSIGLVFYMKFLYGQSKGSAIAGTDAFKNPNEYYSSEEIDIEQMDVGDGLTVAYPTLNLNYTPVKPGTVKISFTSSGVPLVITDDGNGKLVGDIGALSTIVYTSGLCSFTTVAAPDAGSAIDANYLYNMEANATVPQFDMQLTSAPVRAMVRKMRILWSMEAAQDLMDMHGLDAETEQAGAMVSKLKAEIDREGINDMVRIALGTIPAWSKSPAGGVSITEHYLSFMNRLTEGQNTIFTNTQIASGNWMVGGTNVANVVETLPGFVRAQKPKGVRGVYKAGSIMDLDFYKDPNFMVSNVAAPGKYIIGLKSGDMFETGYIHAPYIMAYTTQKIELDDFIIRKGTASRYGKKAVDGNFYAVGEVTV